MLNPPKRLLPALCALALLAACAPSVKPDGADAARGQLRALQADSALAARVPSAVLEADAAVRAAEQPTRDLVAGQHAVYVAQRKVGIARAEAERRAAEETLTALKQQRETILNEGRTREVEIARAQTEAAAAAALAQQRAALAAQQEAANARAMTAELSGQMELLQARLTEHGMVMTLGDALFSTGKSELQAGAAERLNQLAEFMHRYIDRTLLIEGHTDSQGSDEKNLALSLRRAEAVRAYLISQSVAAARMTTAGRSKDAPVADNATAEGRLQNRRVEIVIRSASDAP